MRIEKDGLGELSVPEDVYYGIQSFRASKNFPFPLDSGKSLVLIKQQ